MSWPRDKIVLFYFQNKKEGNYLVALSRGHDINSCSIYSKNKERKNYLVATR